VATIPAKLKKLTWKDVDVENFRKMNGRGAVCPPFVITSGASVCIDRKVNCFKEKVKAICLDEQSEI